MRNPTLSIVVLAALAVALPKAATAGQVEVVKAEAKREQGGAFTFSATLRHADTGWEHYADSWEVLAPWDRPRYCQLFPDGFLFLQAGTSLAQVKR